MARQYSLCQVRRQSICVRYEDVLQDWKGWLYAVRDTFGLQTRAGFPQQVILLFWQLCCILTGYVKALSMPCGYALCQTTCLHKGTLYRKIWKIWCCNCYIGAKQCSTFGPHVIMFVPLLTDAACCS